MSYLLSLVSVDESLIPGGNLVERLGVPRRLLRLSVVGLGIALAAPLVAVAVTRLGVAPVADKVVDRVERLAQEVTRTGKLVLVRLGG